MDITTRLHIERIEEWRNWLESNHLTETEIWLVFFELPHLRVT